MSAALAERFEKFNYDYLQFDLIENPPSMYADITAFLTLEKLIPAERPGRDMISYATHDEITLGVDTDEFEKVATDEDILTLVRCGVRYCADNDCFEMFV